MEQTTKAPLKPQQRLFVLRTNILPALLHQLVLAEYTEGYLDSLDLMVKSRVKLWFKLPHDTVTPFFYANYRDGGLGLVCLRFTVPAMKFFQFPKASQCSECQSEEVHPSTGKTAGVTMTLLTVHWLSRCQKNL